jgi:hypothetical protein
MAHNKTYANVYCQDKIEIREMRSGSLEVWSREFFKDDVLVKSIKSRHSRENGSPELAEKTG